MLDLSMKNLLARGGIEFLAVFIGIVLSLWVDDWRGDRELRHRLEEDYKKIHIEVKADIVNIDSIISSNQNHIENEEYLLSVINKKEKFHFDKVVNSIATITSPTFFGNNAAYSSSVASGRFNTASHNQLSNQISNLYEHYYKRLILNGDLLDQRAVDFNRDYSIKFYRPIYNQNNIDTVSLKTYFYSKNFHNGLLRNHHFRKVNYMKRLFQTREQMVKVDNHLNNHFYN